jgi:DegV family protein with EDD domain
MAGVAVVTDTTTYLPRELVERHGLHEVSLYVNWNGRAQRESEITDYAAFYAQLRSSSEMPSTSQPSVGDFLEVYEPLLAQGRDIVSVHLSGGISGTVLAAEQARTALVERGVAEQRVVVVDSRTAGAGVGMMAIAAANAAARDGATAADVAAATLAVREVLKMWFALETLEFLRRGGRIGAAGAWLGSALKIKPILTFEETVQPVERVRTSARAFERLVEFLQDRHDAGCDVWFMQHIQAHDAIERLTERGREIFGRDPELVSEMGPVVGAHAGPGLIGVSGLPGRLVGPV